MKLPKFPFLDRFRKYRKAEALDQQLKDEPTRRVDPGRTERLEDEMESGGTVDTKPDYDNGATRMDLEERATQDLGHDSERATRREEPPEPGVELTHQQAQEKKEQKTPLSVENLKKGVRIDQYVLEKHLGRGGMGEVWKAFDKKLKREVALKFLTRHRSQEDIARLVEEARAIASHKEHPRVAMIYDVNADGDIPYLVQRYILGQDLSKEAAIAHKGKKLTNKQILQWYDDALQGVRAHHETDSVHRDLKPDNFMVSPFGLVLMDFGISAKLEEVSEGYDDVAGTLPYMSPEQIRGRTLDPRSDIFSLGLIFHELFTAAPARPSKELTFRKLFEEVGEEVLPELVERSYNQQNRAGVMHLLTRFRERYDAETLRTLIERSTKAEPEERWSSIEAMQAFKRKRENIFNVGKFLAYGLFATVGMATTLTYITALSVWNPNSLGIAEEATRRGNELVRIGESVAAKSFFARSDDALDSPWFLMDPTHLDERGSLDTQNIEGLGDAALALGERGEAKAYFQRAQGEVVEGSRHYRLLQAKIEQADERFDEAIEIYKGVWDRERDISVVRQLVELRWKRGDEEDGGEIDKLLREARTHIEDIIPKSEIPTNEQAYDLARLDLTRAWVLRQKGRIGEAGALYEHIINTAVMGRGDKLLGAIVKMNYSIYRAKTGQGDAARDVLDEAIAAIEEWQSEQGMEEELPIGPLGVAHDAYAYLKINENDFRAALAHSDEAIRVFEKLNSDEGLANALYNRSTAYLNLGDLERAVSDAERSCDLAVDLENTYQVGIALTNLGEAAYQQGQFTEAADFLSKAVDAFGTEGDEPAYRDFASVDELLVKTERGLGTDEDLEAVGSAVAKDQYNHAYFLMVKGIYELRHGAFEEANTTFEQAVARAGAESFLQQFAYRARAGQVRALDGLGRHDDAQEVLDDLLWGVEKTNNAFVQAQAGLAATRHYIVIGDADAAINASRYTIGLAQRHDFKVLENEAMQLGARAMK